MLRGGWENFAVQGGGGADPLGGLKNLGGLRPC